MLKQTPGKIYLADQRGHEHAAHYNRNSTFNFGIYNDVHKAPFRRLYVLNEEQLAAASHSTYTPKQPVYVVVLPVTGALEVEVNVSDKTKVEVEQAWLQFVAPGQSFQITNPYPDSVISFLQIWILASATPAAPGQVANFTLDYNLNKLAPVLPAVAGAGEQPFALSLACLHGREELNYCLQREKSAVFAFVLSGAFEVEGRLLHTHDGLALWNTETVEIEALSNHALLLLLELFNA
ncbi:hypothetical protein FVR03_07805 [Pontibacter qinzhouensis]|uniref:Quercetin 2,3-dioxygenase C-terminal cupin domain-containing protein n=1 Tax=Pontibacter qinzhouensis TaxID=2603253 RepID=A0A5C8K7R8_9BACT|nr:hypothetical protein [Pontibacter qinzhouensis]TXK48754.1 hypothetical protein FVR03_07805 [Pontibacter qinzhouensis]